MHQNTAENLCKIAFRWRIVNGENRTRFGEFPLAARHLRASCFVLPARMERGDVGHSGSVKLGA